MKPKDVMPFGERRFLLQFFEPIPDHLEFGQYYPAICEIAYPDGAAARLQCIAYWPSKRRNVVGQSLGNWLLVPIITDLPGDLLTKSDLSVTRYGAEVSERFARQWWGEERAWPAFR